MLKKDKLPDTEDLPTIDTDSSRLEEMGVQDSSALAYLWGGLPDDDDVKQSLDRITGRSSPSLPHNIGRTISDISGDDKYVVEGEIARGGMGVVLRAFDRDMRRPVAMKVMQSKVDREHRARFVEEAQVTGQLEHPNIVPIHELGIDSEGRLFFTMKQLKGKSLGQILDEIREYPAVEEARYPLLDLVHSLVHAMNAVAFAHARGVVHRDLKPDNIWIGNFGEIYVVDWGLAKVGAAGKSRVTEPIYPPAPPDPDASPNTGVQENTSAQAGEDPEAATRVASHRRDSNIFITKDGTVAGTPAYMSPEQARGEVNNIDERSDIYGFGAILYEILTLYPPVSGASDKDFIEQVKRGRIIPPRNRTPHRRIPPELEAITMRALQLEPGRRYQSVDNMKADIARFMNRMSLANTREPLGLGLLRLAKQHPIKMGGLGLVMVTLTGLAVAAYCPAIRRMLRMRSGHQPAQITDTTGKSGTTKKSVVSKKNQKAPTLKPPVQKPVKHEQNPELPEPIPDPINDVLIAPPPP